MPSKVGPTNLVWAMALAAAFVLAGWKTFIRPPLSGFVPPSTPVRPANAPWQAAPAGGASASVPRQLSPDGRFEFDARFVSSEPGQAVHAASLAELRNGDLRAVWFSGSREGAGDVAIKTAVLKPENLHWSEEQTLLDRARLQRDLWRYVKKIGNPVITRLPDGSLMLWMVNVSLGGWAGSSLSWTRSTDDGVTWSALRRLVTSPFLNLSTLAKGAPFFYQNGQIGLPVYHEFISKFAEILRLSPEGQIVDKSRIPASQTSLQPVALVQDALRAQLYMRSGRSTAIMASETTDAGQTWSATRATSLPNPDSALAGAVTAAGDQWLAFNPNPKDRQTLALVKAGRGGSFEGVAPWLVESAASADTRLSVSSYERLLSDELVAQGASQAQVRADVDSAMRQLCGAATCSQEFSYPFLLQSQDGYLHLVYTWHRSRIKHVRLNPSPSFQPDAGLPAPRRAASAAH
ncbi:MAG: exo-alpha-sialidase [Polaromonas sp.]|nr:exo-alpha-sialidase [Polaromonas sp.]